MNRSASFGGRMLDPLVKDFAHVINCAVVLVCHSGGTGQPPASGTGQPLVVISSWGLGATPEETVRLSEGGFVGRALAPKRATLEPLHPLLDSSLIHATDPPLCQATAAAIRMPTGIYGRLFAGFVTPPRDRALVLWTTESYAMLMALCLQHPRALSGLLAAARRDALTGCLTYDSTGHELDREINRSARSGLPLSVCFIDLDGFKRVNDVHGHVRGNEVLAEVGAILRHEVRSCDTVGRYGGDEFIAILPETDEHRARALAGRLRAKIAGSHLRSCPEALTASIGVAEWTLDTTRDQLLEAADSALLSAKLHHTGPIAARTAHATAA